MWRRATWQRRCARADLVPAVNATGTDWSVGHLLLTSERQRRTIEALTCVGVTRTTLFAGVRHVNSSATRTVRSVSQRWSVHPRRRTSPRSGGKTVMGPDRLRVHMTSGQTGAIRLATAMETAMALLVAQHSIYVHSIDHPKDMWMGHPQ